MPDNHIGIEFRKGNAYIFSLLLTLISLLISAFIIHYDKTLITNLDKLNSKLKSIINLDSANALLLFSIVEGSWNYRTIFIKSLSNISHLPLDGSKIWINNDTWVSLRDTNSFFYLRNIPKNVLIKYLRLRKIKLNKAVECGDSLMDWYDKDSNPRVNGAESSFYKNLGYFYGTRNSRALQSVMELTNIKGFNTIPQEELYTILTDISEYSSGFVNINTTNKWILAAISNLSLPQAESLIEKFKIIPAKSPNEFNWIIPKIGITVYPSKILRIRTCSKYGPAKSCSVMVVDFRPGKTYANTLYYKRGLPTIDLTSNFQKPRKP